MRARTRATQSSGGDTQGITSEGSPTSDSTGYTFPYAPYSGSWCGYDGTGTQYNINPGSGNYITGPPDD